jgi:hypothetical protein
MFPQWSAATYSEATAKPFFLNAVLPKPPPAAFTYLDQGVAKGGIG